MKYIGQRKYDKNGYWKRYLGSGIYLKRAVKKYGRENFERKILCECETKEECDEMEKKYIAESDAVNNPMYYNISAGGQGSSFPTTEETKKKISEANLKHPWKNGHPWIGRHHTEETKEKLRQSKLGKPGWKPSKELKQKKRESTPHKKCMCIETNVVYESISQAEQATGIDRGSISHVCHGKYNIAGGYHWRFAD